MQWSHHKTTGKIYDHDVYGVAAFNWEVHKFKNGLKLSKKRENTQINRIHRKLDGIVAIGIERKRK